MGVRPFQNLSAGISPPWPEGIIQLESHFCTHTIYHWCYNWMPPHGLCCSMIYRVEQLRKESCLCSTLPSTLSLGRLVHQRTVPLSLLFKRWAANPTSEIEMMTLLLPLFSMLNSSMGAWEGPGALVNQTSIFIIYQEVSVIRKCNCYLRNACREWVLWSTMIYTNVQKMRLLKLREQVCLLFNIDGKFVT